MFFTGFLTAPDLSDTPHGPPTLPLLGVLYMQGLVLNVWTWKVCMHCWSFAYLHHSHVCIVYQRAGVNGPSDRFGPSDLLGWVVSGVCWLFDFKYLNLKSAGDYQSKTGNFNSFFAREWYLRFCMYYAYFGGVWRNAPKCGSTRKKILGQADDRAWNVHISSVASD